MGRTLYFLRAGVAECPSTDISTGVQLVVFAAQL